MFGMMGPRCHVFALFLVSIFSSLHSTQAQGHGVQNITTDVLALLAFRKAAGGGGVLNSWMGTNPCGTSRTPKWYGIECNPQGRVSDVILPNSQLSGTIPDDSLANLSELKSLNLANNSFNGPFPSDLSKLDALLSLYADNSNFTGPFPNISTGLYLVDLSFNNLYGKLPDALSGLRNLTTLNLRNNSFSGVISELPLSNLQALNLSNNDFSGSIPPDVGQRFQDPSIFAGNSGLCGEPLNTCAVTSPTSPSHSNDPTQAPSPGHSKKGLSTLNIVFICVGALVVLGVILYFLVAFRKKKEKSAAQGSPAEKGLEMIGDDSIQGAMSAMGGEGGDRSKLNFIDDSQHGYDLEDLLRASAEMLGKGSFGTAYKAVMESGMIVAVKRLRDVKDMSKKEFDIQMETLGRLRHPNLVPLRAYYYAKEEKLLIYDFMPNGSLFSLLHGSRGPGRTPLEWHARLSIAQGVAQGLTYLHRESAYKIPHGNIKSSNVLMGKNFEVCISDFGLVPLMPSQTAAQRMTGYRAPEFSYAKKISHKADVYSFGVLLLELLTGRQPALSINDSGIDLPKWVLSVVREEWTGEVFDLELKSFLHGEEEMVALLQIAMSCVEAKPELRPEMAAVVGQLDGIKRGNVADFESYQSRSTEGDYSHEIGSHPDYSTSNLGTPEPGSGPASQ